MSAGLKSLQTTTLRVTNPGERTVSFCLEPWAREYSLEPHCSVDVVFESDSPGVPEVFHEPERIVVYAWPGAAARVLRDGVELLDQSQGC
jgi:hypothetical protein